MLVLSRKVGEEIIIDGSIRVTITAIKGSQVRIGITAPHEVSVNRAEVDRRLRQFSEPEPMALSK
jgi:carbon storage regulator